MDRPTRATTGRGPGGARWRGPAALVIGAAFALVATACQATVTPIPATPTPSFPPATPTPVPGTPAPTEDVLVILQRIQDQVAALRGLAPTKSVVPQFPDDAAFDAIIARIVAEDIPPDELRKAELLYRTLGLMTGDATLQELYLDLLTTQVAGLYDPVTEGLYVRATGAGIGPVEQVYFAHEFQHALQDQHFDLEALQDLPIDQGDRILAQQALVEGDAYVLMTQWLLGNLGPEGLSALIAASSDPEAQAALDAIPRIVQAQILFSALEGTLFVQGLQAAGGWAAVDAALADPPVSSEQVLHPEKYAAREAPIEVSLPSDPAGRMGAGWTEVLRDTLGEHQLGIWLDAEGSRSTAAEIAAAAVGWGGDRLILLESATATGAAIVTEWDTANDAAEFAEVAQAAIEARGLAGGVVRQPGSRRVTVLIASDDAAAIRLDLVFGITGV